MEDQNQQNQAQTQAPQLTGQQPVTTTDTSVATSDPVVTPPTVVDPAPAPTIDPTPAAATASAAAEAPAPTEQADDPSVGQMIGAQMARARNALAHMEEATAREVHAALGEIESILGIK